MKNKTIALMICLSVSSIIVSAQQSNQQKFKKLEWLIGKWIRTNSKPGESGYEEWSKVSNVKLVGKGVTLAGKEVAFTESLEFIVKGKEIFYSVIVTGDKKPVLFKLTALSDDGFTCENPTHDFPKKIAYRRKGNTAVAVVSAGDQKIEYLFKRSKQN